MDYADYLHLDRILDSQAPQSKAHDEMLFIIQHQTSELWMKLAIKEIRAARAALIRDELEPSFKMFARIARIFEQLNTAWDVLRTMTPSEYTQFRGDLGGSSGFQSHQYREIEFLLGNRNAAMLKPHEKRPGVHDALDQLLNEPSLYDEALRHLSRQGLPVPAHSIDRDWRDTRGFDEQVMAAWAEVYRNPDRYWTQYNLAEKLVDMEDYFRRWRFNHVTTVERIIGLKPGTGGTQGVSYLRRMLEVELFPELWRVRTAL